MEQVPSGQEEARSIPTEEPEHPQPVADAITQLAKLVQESVAQVSKADVKLRTEFRKSAPGRSEINRECRRLLKKTNLKLKRNFRAQRDVLRRLALLCGVDTAGLPRFLLREQRHPQFLQSSLQKNAPSPGGVPPQQLTQQLKKVEKKRRNDLNSSSRPGEGARSGEATADAAAVRGKSPNHLHTQQQGAAGFATPTRSVRKKKIVSLLKIHKCVMLGLSKCSPTERAPLLLDLSNVSEALTKLGVAVASSPPRVHALQQSGARGSICHDSLPKPTVKPKLSAGVQQAPASPTAAKTSTRTQSPSELNVDGPGFEYLFAKIMAGPSATRRDTRPQVSASGSASTAKALNSMTKSSKSALGRFQSPNRSRSRSGVGKLTPPGSRKRPRRRSKRSAKASREKLATPADPAPLLSDNSSSDPDELYQRPPKKLRDQRGEQRSAWAGTSARARSPARVSKVKVIESPSSLGARPPQHPASPELIIPPVAYAAADEGVSTLMSQLDLEDKLPRRRVSETPLRAGVKPVALFQQDRDSSCAYQSTDEAAELVSPSSSFAHDPAAQGVPAMSPFPPMSPIMQANDKSAMFVSHDDFSVVQTLNLSTEQSPRKSRTSSAPSPSCSKAVRGRPIRSPTVRVNLARSPSSRTRSRGRSPGLNNKVNLRHSIRLARPSTRETD